MTTGELIRTARKMRGLTQKALGEISGIAEPTIRRYELGKLNPKYQTLQKIASALDVNVGLFIDLGDWESILHALSKYCSDDCTPEELLAAELAISPDDVKSVIESDLDNFTSQRLKLTARILIEDLDRLQKKNEPVIDLGSDTFIKVSDGTLVSLPTGTIEARLLVNFSNLNDDGKRRASDYLSELTEIPKYKKERQPE